MIIITYTQVTILLTGKLLLLSLNGTTVVVVWGLDLFFQWHTFSSIFHQPQTHCVPAPSRPCWPRYVCRPAPVCGRHTHQRPAYNKITITHRYTSRTTWSGRMSKPSRPRLHRASISWSSWNAQAPAQMTCCASTAQLYGRCLNMRVRRGIQASRQHSRSPWSLYSGGRWK